MTSISFMMFYRSGRRTRFRREWRGILEQQTRWFGGNRAATVDRRKWFPDGRKRQTQNSRPQCRRHPRYNRRSPTDRSRIDRLKQRKKFKRKRRRRSFGTLLQIKPHTHFRRKVTKRKSQTKTKQKKNDSQTSSRPGTCWSHTFLKKKKSEGNNWTLVNESKIVSLYPRLFR